jgi:opacity protein-like surface antigen
MLRNNTDDNMKPFLARSAACREPLRRCRTRGTRQNCQILSIFGNGPRPVPLWSAVLLLMMFPFSIRAQQVDVTGNADATGNPSFELEADWSYVGGSRFDKRSREAGDISETVASINLVASWRLTDTLLLRTGAGWERYWFDKDPNVPAPNILESANLVIGADFQLTPAILIRAEAQPGFYNDGRGYSFDDLNVPFLVGGTYFVSADLQIVGGVGVDVNREVPILPAAGVRWKFARSWVLNAILPNPRLEYLLNDKISLHAGAEIRYATYRVDRDFGTAVGVSRLDGAIVDYTEIRAGAGVSWQITPAVNLDLEAGCVPYRRFDFERAKYKVRSDELAPFAQVAVSAKF